ncbi:MAG: hypothetical protein LBJ00_16760 [Planctomycetaceae bacterium]|nr:hypothetical protein [Planctomycetaceae bacterium]
MSIVFSLYNNLKVLTSTLRTIYFSGSYTVAGRAKLIVLCCLFAVVSENLN